MQRCDGAAGKPARPGYGKPHERTPAHPLVRRVLDGDPLAMDVEKLTTELVLQHRASANEPAENRRSIVRVQWQLAYAYIEQPS